DSDFSSLVLKLKEYGKYGIGVGISESSSDLLIQNCDEYYSYNELAGLTKESDVTHVRHDPWELVVEAVKQMTAHNDVMRSDRLKQVMQEIDPTFNEKDVGFSRFSKFVVEAAHKGLIHLTKLDNGQYEISLGPGVPGAAAQPGRAARAESREEQPREAARGGGGGGGRRDEGRGRRAAAGGGGGGFSLGEAFGLLKQALSRLGGGDKAVSADELRETMIELKGGEAEPLEVERFPKLLRQAHDAEIIDLSKERDGAYEVKLREESPPSMAAAAPEPAAVSDADEALDPPMPESSAPPPLVGRPAPPRGPRPLHPAARRHPVAQRAVPARLSRAACRTSSRGPEDRRRGGRSELQTTDRAAAAHEAGGAGGDRECSRDPGSVRGGPEGPRRAGSERGSGGWGRGGGGEAAGRGAG